jgi:hypothetical protein
LPLFLRVLRVLSGETPLAFVIRHDRLERQTECASQIIDLLLSVDFFLPRVVTYLDFEIRQKRN